MASEHDDDLTLLGVGKSYGELQVLQPTNLQVRSGEFLTIVGPSGSGKTTLLRLISGFTTATCGSVRFLGQDITNVPTHRRPFNTVFQDYALFPHMTVAENVGYGPMIRRVPREEAAQKVNDALAIVGLQKLTDRMPSQLSGGQKQRVALARALVCEPKVLLLDEPLSALDAEMRYQMQMFLKDLQRRVDTTFILVTHDQEEAITMSDRIAVMSNGRIEQIGSHRDVYYAPQTRFVANFFGDTNLVEAKVGPDGSLETVFGRFAYAGADLGNNSMALLSLRPEAIRLAPSGPDDTNGSYVNLKARVSKVVFAGSLTRLVVTPHDKPTQDLLVKINSAQAPPTLTEGMEAAISFAAKDMAIVSDIVPSANADAASRPRVLSRVASS